MESVKVELPEDIVNYLQSLDYEIGGLRVLHTHALNADTPEEKVMEIRNEFTKKYQEYQLAKEEVFREFGKDHLNCKRWWVDFYEGVMYFAT